MGSRTGIQWTDATWNPVTGCKAVSPGCANCYAATLAATRLAETPRYKGLAVLNDAGRGVWSGGVRLHPDKLHEPLRWRKPRKIFVCDMSDLFHEDVPEWFLDRVFAVMAIAKQHTFQLLTKRPARAADYLSAPLKIEDLYAQWHAFSDGPAEAEAWPLPNVWIGTSVENQRCAVERIPYLLQTPAAVRFLSCEPLLGPLDLHDISRTPGAGDDVTEDDDVYGPPLGGIDGVDWVIVGGESGRNARPCNVQWIRDLVRQCKDAGAAVFVKQLGSQPGFDPADVAGTFHHAAGGLCIKKLNDHKGGDPSEWPEDLRVREMPEVSR